MLHHLVLATRRLAPLLLTAALGACGSAPSLAPPITADPQAPKAGATLTDSLGIVFARVPAGEFLMGSDESPQALAQAFPHADPKRDRPGRRGGLLAASDSHRGVGDR